jgi:8-oxo-dGTP diphosphatase
MDYKGRAQSLVIRENKILMVKHKCDGDEWFCLPGGGIEKEETPAQAAIRELQEECLVSGTIVKKISEYVDPYNDNGFFYTFHIDIGNQNPSLGYDPEMTENPILIDVCWMALNEISEIDRAYLWSAGLLSIVQYADELSSWNRDISYPSRRIV